MKPGHFEQLRPICPVCRNAGLPASTLKLADCFRESAGEINQGMLTCSNVACQREYPIIDGLPLIIADLRTYLAANELAVWRRADLHPSIESVLGDCGGPESALNSIRGQLSNYTWDHYADLDPNEDVENYAPDARPGSVIRLLGRGLELAGDVPDGPLLDIGCGVGRTSFELADRDRLVLGIDLNLPMLRLAAEVNREGRVSYPRRRVGIVYDRREFDVSLATDRVDFWACDAAALPFAAGQFAAVVGLNVLDCSAAPRELLASVGNALIPNGKFIMGCPYDWSTAATPIETWLGGHSQRSESAGASEPVVRSLLTPEAHPQSIEGLRMIAEQDDLVWRVRLHDRSTVEYRVHLVVAQRDADNVRSG